MRQIQANNTKLAAQFYEATAIGEALLDVIKQERNNMVEGIVIFTDGRLTEGSQSAIRWTKHTLNHWYRAQSAVLDASLAYEFLGFSGPDAREGLASHRDKRDPSFDGPTSE